MEFNWTRQLLLKELNILDGLAQSSGSNYQLGRSVLFGYITFSITLSFMHLTTWFLRREEQLIEISIEYGLRNCFKILPLINFLLGLREMIF
jgi:hypothetical protein